MYGRVHLIDMLSWKGHKITSMAALESVVILKDRFFALIYFVQIYSISL